MRFSTKTRGRTWRQLYCQFMMYGRYLVSHRSRARAAVRCCFWIAAEPQQKPHGTLKNIHKHKNSYTIAFLIDAKNRTNTGSPSLPWWSCPELCRPSSWLRTPELFLWSRCRRHPSCVVVPWTFSSFASQLRLSFESQIFVPVWVYNDVYNEPHLWIGYWYYIPLLLIS